MELPNRIGANVRHFRQERGLSQLDLARLGNFSQSFISHVESGQRSPSIESAMVLAEALDVTINELLEEVEYAA